MYCPPKKSTKYDEFSSPSRVHIKEELEEKKPFEPMTSAQDTGCGTTVYKPLNMFSNTGLNIAVKVDEDFSSMRSPLEVLKDLNNDPTWIDTITEDQKRDLDDKASKLKLLDPSCNCKEADSRPFYIHIGHAESVQKLRIILEERFEVTGKALRLLAVRMTTKEGKTQEDCPIAKWIVKRAGPEEQFLAVYRTRYGHTCPFAVTAVCLIKWDGVPTLLADDAYETIAERTARFGSETERQCASNKKKTCACQGTNAEFNGASYTFGCSWTMYHNICKFCRSADVHKFKLNDYSAEVGLEQICQKLTDHVTPLYEKMAPDSFLNMCLFENIAPDCRIGTATSGRPFSGITCVCDFCAHSHKDSNNMIGGVTVIVSLLRPEDRHYGAKEDQQFHVLPLHVPDLTEEEVQQNVAINGLDVLSKFQRTIAIRERKRGTCKRGRINPERKRMLDDLKKDEALLKHNKEEELPRLEKDLPFDHPSLCPPGFEEKMPQLDGLDDSIDEEGELDGTVHNLADVSMNSSFDLHESYETMTDELVDKMEETKISLHESDCLEAFEDPNIGGVAFELPHGSVMIECAKQELHATTALKKPNKTHPHRIGLVFYQHKNLHHPNHGAEEFQRKRITREFRDYVQWLKGNYVPTEGKIRAMRETGLVFDADWRVGADSLAKPMDVALPNNFFTGATVDEGEVRTKKAIAEMLLDKGPEKSELQSTKGSGNVDDEVNIFPTQPSISATDLTEIKIYEGELAADI